MPSRQATRDNWIWWTAALILSFSDLEASAASFFFEEALAEYTVQPDLAIDASALFRHLRENGFDLNEHKRWCFMFQADRIEPLEELGQFLDSRLREYFHVLLQDSTEVLEEDGTMTEGPPMLRLEFVGIIDEPMLAGMHKRLHALAEEYGVQYTGCTSSSEFPFDLDMFEAALSDTEHGGSEWNVE